MTSDHRIFDRRLLAHRRERHSADAADCEFLLLRAADDLAWRLSLTQRSFAVAVNLGAHHGLVSRALRALPGIDFVIDADTSPGLLAQCEGPRVVADEEMPPFRPRTLDLVVSGLSLHHVNDLPGTLVQIERALKPDGLFLAALLGGRTLFELRAALLEAETQTMGGASPRVSPFADVRELGALLQRAGFALPVADSDVFEVGYPSVLELMRDLRTLGGNVLTDRSRRPLRRDTLQRAVEIYAERFARADGRVRATFEIVALTGWSPHASQQRPLRPGTASVRLAHALGVPETGTDDKAG